MYHQPTPTTATVVLSAENIKHIGSFNLNIKYKPSELLGYKRREHA